MFFFFSVYNDKRRLDFYQRGNCPICKTIDGYYIVLTYSCFSLFLIPIIKFNKRHYLCSENCNSYYEINKDFANRLIKHQEVLNPEAIPFVSNYRKEKRCNVCGNTINEDFIYCPKCGSKLK